MLMQHLIKLGVGEQLAYIMSIATWAALSADFDVAFRIKVCVCEIMVLAAVYCDLAVLE